MTAKQIREFDRGAGRVYQINDEEFSSIMLQEIAAQIAELVEYLKGGQLRRMERGSGG